MKISRQVVARRLAARTHGILREPVATKEQAASMEIRLEEVVVERGGRPLVRAHSVCIAAGRVTAFAGILMDAGIVTTVRKTRGDDIDAACGQLAGEVQDRTRVVERMAKRRTINIQLADAGAPTYKET